MPLHLTLSAALLAVQVPPSGTIEGVVRGYEPTSGRTLAYATVEAASPGEHRSAVADSVGRYRFEDLPAGLVRLRISHPGHRSARVDVQIPAGGTVFLDVDLEQQPILLSPIEVLTDPVALGAAPEGVDPPIPEMEVVTLALSPGLGEAGLGEAAATVARERPGGSVRRALHARVDDGPEARPSGRGSGLHSVPPGGIAEQLRRVRPGRGGSARGRCARPVRRRALLHSGSPDQDPAARPVAGAGGARPDQRGRRPRGPSGWPGAVRHLNAYASRSRGHRPGGLAQSLRLSRRPGEGGRGDRSRPPDQRDHVLEPGVGPPLFGRPTRDAWCGSSGSGGRLLGQSGVDRGLSRGSRRRHARRGRLGQRVSSRASSAAREHGGGRDGLFGGAARQCRDGRLRLTLDASTPFGESRMRFGGAVDRVTTRYSAREFADLASGPGDEREANGVVAGGYVDGVLPLVPGLDLRAGARADAFSTESRLRVAPRIAFLWSLSADALLTVAAGRYHQYTRASEEQVELAVSDGAPVSVTGPLLSVAAADHVVLSLDQRLGRGVRLGVEGFWKGFSGLATPRDDVLRSSGVDLRVLHESARATAWLGYNLAWFWSGTSGLSASNFAGRQLLSAGITGMLDGRTGGSLKVAYSAGLPYTSIPFGRRGGDALTGGDGPAAPQTPELPGEAAQEDPVFGGEPDDGFLRLDLELFARFNPRIGGRAVEIRPYLRLINALDQRDALFYYFEPWRDEEFRPLAERSVLPVFGMEWRF